MSGPAAGSVFARLRGRPDTEHEMSFNRLAFALVITLYLFWQEAPTAALVLVGLYWLVAIGLFLHILRFPATNIPRRATALTLDIAFLCMELHAGGEITSALAPIYLWVILGNGFRFGVPWLRAGMAISVTGFVTVVATTPFWQQQPHLSGGFLLGLIAIPAYAATLIRKLEAARQQAEQANQAKTMFLASVSHELRTPLNAIIGMGALLERSRLDADQREMARTVTDAGRHLLGLIDGILDFSRIEAGRMPIHPAPLDLAELLAEIARLLSRQVEEKGLRLQLHATPRTPRRVLADPRLMRELLLNLAGNAVKFTDTGSVVIAFDAEPAEVPDKIRLVLEVTDTGIGIAPEAQTRIFDSFTQADPTIINRYGGTGLGLAICKRIVEGMGGEIGVDSTPGRGSTFRCVLPLARDSTPVAPLAGEAVALSPAGGEVAAPPGVVVHRTTSLAEAVAQLQALPPGAPRVLLAPATVFGATAEDVARTLALLDPPGAWRVILLAADAPTGLPPPALRRVAVRLLPAAAEAAAVAEAIGFAAALGAPAEAPAAEAAPPAGRSLSILVADDNKVNRRVVQRILESAGHRATLVSNGEEALDALEEARFDLVLMDVNMPVMDGIEAAKLYQLQSLGRRRVPILALTADATPEARQRCLEAGMDGCLTKPVTPAALLEAVRTHALPEASPAEPAPVAEIASHPRFRPSGLPALDEGALADLDALGGADFVQEVVQEFLSDAETLIADLGRAAAARDSVAFRAKAHALRSASANVGARALGELCRAAKEITPEDLALHGAQQVDRLAAELARVRQVLLRHIGTSPAARQG